MAGLCRGKSYSLILTFFCATEGLGDRILVSPGTLPSLLMLTVTEGLRGPEELPGAEGERGASPLTDTRSDAKELVSIAERIMEINSNVKVL